MDLEQKLNILEAQKANGMNARISMQIRLGEEELRVIEAYRKKYGLTVPNAIRNMILGWNDVLNE